MIVLRTAALALLCATGCGSGGGAAAPPDPSPSALNSPRTATSIWFHPLPPPAVWPHGPSTIGINGSADFMSLFEANAAWPNVLAKTQVLGMYGGWVAQTTDQALGQTVAFLNAHNMGIELEGPALQATASCGAGVEGYVAPEQTVRDVTLGYLQRLKALNADVRFIKVDEPLFFGNVVSDPRSCHLALSEIANQVAAYTAVVHTVYPNAQVGDVEPIIASAYTPDVVTVLGLWQDAYRSATGAPFPFFIADIDFSNPAWPALVKTIETQTRGAGLRFGIIYIGDPQDASDVQWTAKVVSRFQIYEGTNGGRPDYALFQSWHTHPTRCLPENDPTTFTGAIDAYLKPWR